MTKAGLILRAIALDIEAANSRNTVIPQIDRILQKIAKLDPPGREHFESYMRHKWRMNHKPNTLKGSYNALSSFLTFYGNTGKKQIEDIVSSDVEAFVEHVQDQGLKISTVRTRLHSLFAFLRFLIEQDVIDARILKRKIRLKVPDLLPRAIAPSDVKSILGVIKDSRDRALILVLLRTGMRIGELLRLHIRDLDVRERKIHIFNGKGSKDRVVYLSEDALTALEVYMKKRKWSKERRVFLVRKGPLRGKPISVRGIQKRIEYYAKRTGIKISCHHLRHTMATQLLNADAALVTIQDLLGHSRITTTQCYCRVSNLKVQRDYFKAINIVLQKTQPIREDNFELGRNS
jgi:site-specific recombinase XerD